MAWNFRRRIKILPGVKINLSKGGLSASVGTKGANVTFGKKGTFLNTGIPGTGLYNRQKIGGKTSIDPIKLQSKSSQNTNKEKKYNGCGIITIVGVLGLFASLYFYQVKYALFIYGIGIIGLIIVDFLVNILVESISKKNINNVVSSVDLAYNQKVLEDNNQAVLNDNNITNFNEMKYISESQFNLINEYLPSLEQIITRLENDKSLKEILYPENSKKSSSQDSIKYLVIYDLLKISNIILEDKFTADRIESYSMVIITGSLSDQKIKNFLNLGYRVFNLVFTEDLLNNTFNALLQFSKIENPVKIKAFTKSNSENDLVNKQSLLALPMFLKVNNSTLLDEYASILYQFANIIIKADNTVTEKEQKLLSQVYELTHKPEVEIKDSNNSNSKIIAPTSETETLDEVLQELYSLIGLDEVKEQIASLMNFIKVQKAREEAGLKSSSISYHVVFTGNPGTGKTTVARILARIYKIIGLVQKGQIVETDRSGLIAEYSGQTAVKVNKVIDSAIDGILFIDEAYALVAGDKDDYGNEAVATLIKRMEDDREKLIVIIAGYTNEMTTFINTNPGFKSRFNRYINFSDYNAEDLVKIFKSNCEKLDYHLSDKATEKIIELFKNAYSTRDATFGNGRYVRNIFEKTLENQANRIATEVHLSKEILTSIIEEDILGN